MSSSDVSPPLEIRQADILISFAIAFLTECDRTKKWKKLPGRSAETCGYTAPGIGLLLRLFTDNGISSLLTLQSYLTRQSITQELFMDIVNETIGNLLDLSPECPVTQTIFGIRGLILLEKYRKPQDPPNVYKVTRGGSNLAPGPNIISFTGRDQFGCETFHHAVIHIIPEVNACNIIDSWRSPTGACRPLTSRLHNLQEVIGIIDELNSDTITPERTYIILSLYFLAHNETTHKMILIFNNVMVHTINPLYIQHIYNECERMIRTRAQIDTNFGGKTRKKYKNRRTTRGKNRQNKKYKTTKYKSNRKYKIYRGTLIKNKKA